MTGSVRLIQDYPMPLIGLTAWQGITEELEAKRGESLLIPGGSGSFGQMAVPIAKALGLRVIVTGNGRAKESLLAAGVKYDRIAKKQGKEYRFIFVRSDGTQLQKITKLVEHSHIIPKINPHTFTSQKLSAEDKKN